MDTEILHFGHSGADKIKFEVGRSKINNFRKWQFSKMF